MVIIALLYTAIPSLLHTFYLYTSINGWNYHHDKPYLHSHGGMKTPKCSYDDASFSCTFPICYKPLSILSPE
ncbi:hypothetical protein F4811DRAFT_508806 [Daldinia bambusicola]|nr:hypothetical protein F4811DRAFT_508806 [Daldinia bambusicola]